MWCSDGVVELVYPRGSTLNVQEPAVPIITSGFISSPLNRPIGAVSVNKASVAVCSRMAFRVCGGRWWVVEWRTVWCSVQSGVT